jgi:hypothetical protein
MVTINDKRQVFYKESFIGKIKEYKDDGSFVFVSAFVGGLRIGNSLLDILLFAAQTCQLK